MSELACRHGQARLHAVLGLPCVCMCPKPCVRACRLARHCSLAHHLLPEASMVPATPDTDAANTRLANLVMTNNAGKEVPEILDGDNQRVF
eukprot:1154144-Pelagomonas_calceolata.AAC.2